MEIDRAVTHVDVEVGVVGDHRVRLLEQRADRGDVRLERLPVLAQVFL